MTHRGDEHCDDPECYGCRLEDKGIGLSNAITGSRTKNMRPTPSEPPSLNKQIMYDERPGGFKMPILKANGDPLRHKEWRENKKSIESNIRRIRTSSPGSDSK